jgi:hypothetical protein
MQLEFLKNASNEVTLPEVTDKDIEEVIKMSLSYAPRFLYTFFDDMGIFVGVRKNESGYYSDVDGFLGTQTYPTRSEAEKEGWEAASEKLNIVANES